MKRRNMNKFKLFAIVCILMSIILLIKLLDVYIMEFSVNRYKMLNSFVRKSGKSDQKIILFWTRFFGQEFGDETNINYLESINCPETNCIFTENKKMLMHHEFDAIVFHGAESWKLMNLPNTRSPHQIYVMASQE